MTDKKVESFAENISTNTQLDTFFCRSCYKIQVKQDHSQKSCINSKRQKQQQEEDLWFERKKFIKENNLTVKFQSPVAQKEITKTESAQQSEELKKKSIKNNISGIFERPRQLRRRRITPWNGSSHILEAKK